VRVPVRGGRCERGGFSLIELVVTIALMSILIGFAMPSLRSVLGSSELTATVNELVFALQTARSEAIKRSAPVALCTSATPLVPDPGCGGDGYADGWIVFADTNGNGTRETDEELILQAEPPGPAFAFTPETTVATGVMFVDSGASSTAGGTPVSGSIRIDHTSDDRARVVTVGANGRIASGGAS